MPHPLNFRSRLFRGDPFGGTVLLGSRSGLLSRMWQSKLAIESQGRLQRHKGPLGSDPPGEGFIEPPRFVLADTCENFDSRRAQALKTSAGIDRIWIVHGRDDTLHAGCDDGFGAWSCASGVIARLVAQGQWDVACFLRSRS